MKIEKSALVTGADGFIGSHLCELLLEKGYKVKALAQYNSFNYFKVMITLMFFHFIKKIARLFF